MSVKAGSKNSPAPDPDLLAAAVAASQRAYAPYSRFYVGCAVRTASGVIYSGCNLENESFPAGVCAERAALAAAVVAEGPTPAVTKMLVYAEDSERKHTACAPCGVCRQVIIETAANARVAFFGDGCDFIELEARDLLPHAFKGHLR
jgi:cytidine deaminase